MNLQKILLLTLILQTAALPARAAEPFNIAACATVTAADAEKFIGAPLDVNKIDKKIMLNAPWTHDSLCTYLPEGVKSDDPTEIARFLDVSLRFFPTAETAQSIHQATLEQFRKMAGSPEAPFKILAITPLEGLNASAFYIELQADPQSDYKSAVITFVKGAIGGAVSAWKKPESSLELSKTVLQHVLAQLP
ncbi:MAG: hypothetical protein ACXWW4_14860 [Candidatus Binatia bacterium]